MIVLFKERMIVLFKERKLIYSDLHLWQAQIEGTHAVLC